MFVLLPLTLLLAGLAVFAFRWAARDGQLDRLDQEAFRPLLDQDELSR
ncbi:MAG: cbb3-type cytochrome oxidase assembly protein CcoS [Planctomycetota bacterium]